MRYTKIVYNKNEKHKSIKQQKAPSVRGSEAQVRRGLGKCYLILYDDKIFRRAPEFFCVGDDEAFYYFFFVFIKGI